MAHEEARAYCDSCGRHVLARRPRANHVLHLLITLFTCGAWILVWPLIAIRFGGWACPACGGPARSDAQASMTPANIALLLLLTVLVAFAFCR